MLAVDVMLSFQGELGADGSAMGFYLSVYSLETWWWLGFCRVRDSSVGSAS